MNTLGHSYFDLQAYDDYLNTNLKDCELHQEEIVVSLIKIITSTTERKFSFFP